MKTRCLPLLSLFLSLTCFSQKDTIHQRIFLIGDAGELVGNTHPTVDWLQKNVDWNDERNVAVYLGDNIYPLGLPMEGEPGYATSKKIIDYQIELVKGKQARAFFVQGNHDWKNGKMGGWQQVMNQVNYINSQEQKNITAQPTEGCPGPVAIDVSEKVVLVMMDSQWFLYIHDKPGPGSNCSSTTIDEFATELKEIVASYPNHLLVFAMHHPMYSYGVHGGDYTWKEHLFPLTALKHNLYIPLPVLGSVYPIARGVFGNIQDVKHPLYQTMVNTIEEVLKDHPNIVVAAGHDHSLQMIMKDSIPFIVSGSGSNLSRVRQKGKQGRLLFSDLNFGFSLLEVSDAGNVTAKFYNLNSKDLTDPTFTQVLKNIDTLPHKIAYDSIPQFPDSVVVMANPNIKRTGMRNIFMGRNYRKEWTTPVKVPVLDLGKDFGGLTPKKQGGGKQTRSLRMEDPEGKDWALRSIEKYPEAAIPADLRSPFAKDVVQDGISASYPYASLSIAPIADAVGIPSIRRKLVYVPDDPRLGRFRSTFKNTLAIIEEREPLGVSKAYNTDELVLRLAKDNDDHVDQIAVLKARLMDNFIMDLDRHEGQWQWATRDTGKGKIYYPIPRDHDQAFYVNQGMIPFFLKKPWFIPEIQGFEAKAHNIKTFNRAARNFDRFFLNELDENAWRTQVDSFLMQMSDSVITASLMRQPPEIRRFRAGNIENTLKRRRNYFRDEMIRYYRFISQEVTIVGTNQRELFTIDKKPDEKVEVTINKISKDGSVSSKIYNRLFDPEVTNELRIFGLEDNDSFVVKGNRSSTKIRIIGGPGKDHFVNEGSGGRLIAYDVSFEENKFSGNDKEFRKVVTSDPQNNMYSRLFYKYDFFNPGTSIGYNIDDGLFLGAQLETTSQGFRKQPYSMRHLVRGRKALATASYQFYYEGDFIRALGKSDLFVRADIRAPINVTNFFGIGNTTVFDKTKPGGIQYYRARYDVVNVSALVRRQLQSWMRVNYGPAFQYFRLEEKQNQGKYVSNTDVNGLDPKSLYTKNMLVGAQVGLDINSKNNRVIPSRGFVLDAGLRTLFGTNSSTNNLTQLFWDMRLFASFESKARIVYAFRLGGGRNFNGDFAFPQAQYLGGTENLRGYRRDRFAGRTMLYNNSEIRFKIADFNTYLFPGAFGLFVFNDVGRVWADAEKSDDWHVGNGGGIWIAPVRRFVITAALTRSKEEKALPLVTFGFQF
ncbi:MAG TPA: BamA/TamA family outer membrane protein [Chitinophagaceae bacterium]|nr:BamA/TamA family outer membrane protein [Chitinophagaceae bacterium]